MIFYKNLNSLILSAVLFPNFSARVVAPSVKEGEGGGGEIRITGNRNRTGRDRSHFSILIRRKMAEMHEVSCCNRLCKALELSRLRIESVDQLPE